MSLRIKTIIAECENHLRAGDTNRVAQQLAKLSSRGVPRPFLQALANICWRAGLVHKGLYFLTRLFHDDHLKLQPPTDGEKLEYAVLLQRIGALPESLRLLSEIDSKSLPAALLYQAFWHFSQWGHPHAIPHLQNYIEAMKDNDYQAGVGRINLAAALIVSERDTEALDLLDETESFLHKRNFFRLLGNCHELKAQVYLDVRDYSRAKEQLNLAKHLLMSVQAYDAFYVEKWQRVCLALESNDEGPLLELRKMAISRLDWEIARDVDRYRLMINPDQKLMNHLVFGTPYPHYRDRLVRQTGLKISSTQYLWGNPNSEIKFDIDHGLFSGSLQGSMGLAVGKKLHQCLGILARDFYRPIRIGTLFYQLFPDERFHIHHSPLRLHQVLHRLRSWSEEHGQLFHVQEIKSSYRLELSSRFALRVPLHHEPISKSRLLWQDVARRFEGQTVSALEIRASINIARTPLQRLLTWALSEGLAERLYKDGRVKYRVKRISSEEALHRSTSKAS